MADRSSKHVVIITGAHLCRNPRVVKEATALGNAGYKVTVVAPVLEDALMDVDAEILEVAPYARVISADVRDSRGLRGRVGRIHKRLANEINYRARTQLPDELGYGVRAALGKARSLDADLYIGHQEVGAWVAWKLMSEGRRVAADLEDWYSRDLLPEAIKGRPNKLLNRCEGDLVREAAYVTTTSKAMADAMERAYGRRPDVVYNAFPWADREQLDGLRWARHDDDRPSLFWFSQTIGPGRGLEMLIDALADVTQPVQLHLQGNLVPEFDSKLLERLDANSVHSIDFHPLVAPGELLSRIAEHDIGLALEPSVPLNKELTISNKILQYLLGGLAVVATPTAGQKEVSALAGDGVLHTERTAGDLAECITSLIGSPERLRRAKRLSLQAAESVFSWEVQEEVLLRLVSTSLDTIPRV